MKQFTKYFSPLQLIEQFKENLMLYEDDPNGGGGTTEPEFDGNKFRDDNTPEVIEKTTEDPIKEPAETTKPEIPAEVLKKPVEEPIVKSDTIDPYWNTIKERASQAGVDYNIPDEILTGKTKDGKELSQQEKFDRLVNESLKMSQLDATPEDDNFIKTYIDKSFDENFNRKEFLENQVKSKSVLEMSDGDILHWDMKKEFGKRGEDDKDGLSDEEIQNEINGMSAITKRREANKIRNKLNEEQTTQKQNAIENYNKQVEQEFKSIIPKHEEYINNYLTSIEGKKNLGGFELSEAEISQYKKDLPELLKGEIVEAEGGVKKIANKGRKLLDELLSTEKGLEQLYPILWMISNNKLQGYSSSLKEQVKEKVEKTLDTEPIIHSGTGGPVDFDSESFRKDPNK